MMMLRGIFLFLVFGAFFSVTGASVAVADEDGFVIDVSSNEVGITTGFTGSSFTVFGTTRQTGDVAIALYGPSREVSVRHKGQLLGMWMNTDSLAFYDVPVYYDVALSKPGKDLAKQSLLIDNYIGLNALEFRYKGKKSNESKAARYREALIRNKQLAGHFPLIPKNVHFITDRFFRADFTVPSDVPTGRYRIRGFLFKDGALIDQDEIYFRVAQVGMSANIYNFAYNSGLLYGIIAVILALMAGAGAYYTLRRD